MILREMVKCWVHQNRASPFASDFRRRLRYRREFRSGNQIWPSKSQRKSPFASDFLRRGNRASWGLKSRAILRGSSENRCRNRRGSRDFGALRWSVIQEVRMVVCTLLILGTLRFRTLSCWASNQRITIITSCNLEHLGKVPNTVLRRPVLGSSRGPCCQRDLC